MAGRVGQARRVGASRRRRGLQDSIDTCRLRTASGRRLVRPCSSATTSVGGWVHWKMRSGGRLGKRTAWRHIGRAGSVAVAGRLAKLTAWWRVGARSVGDVAQWRVGHHSTGGVRSGGWWSRSPGEAGGMNVELLQHFICPHTGEMHNVLRTGVCQKKHRLLIKEIEKAKDHGLLSFTVPHKEYDYEEYNRKHPATATVKTG
uniref:Small ribosomal subunit protein mS40 n=1 Tax=Branchiostoma floridae TaxID=7739 RepID=C3ZCL3_BRAFL|eukprot:XP_002593706.1 hypothetical protein BRAFLDRAFT_117250 [Branchiostoma floridae]